MIRNSFILLFALAALSCSDKESEEPLDLTGEIKGKITLLTEFGQLDPVQEGAVLSFQSGEQEFQAVTDANGDYRIERLPMGTYNVVISKEGFSTFNTRGFTVMGGKAPLYFSFNIRRPSTTKITDLAMTKVNNQVDITGIVTHGNSSAFPFVYIVLFFGDSPDVSPSKHLRSTFVSFAEASGETFSYSVTADTRLFPSGSTLYVVAYGLTNSFSYTTNPETLLIEYHGLGTIPSNVATIKMP